MLATKVSFCRSALQSQLNTRSPLCLKSIGKWRLHKVDWFLVQHCNVWCSIVMSGAASSICLQLRPQDWDSEIRLQEIQLSRKANTNAETDTNTMKIQKNKVDWMQLFWCIVISGEAFRRCLQLKPQNWASEHQWKFKYNNNYKHN